MSNLTMPEQIKNYMNNYEKAKVFSINDFYHLGNMNTVKSALRRMEKEGKISRVIDGLYTIPEYSTLIGEEIYPEAKDVAEKIAEKFSWNISPSENLALNLTGLSTQVPNEYVFVSDGPYRTYNYRGQEIIFKNTSNRFISEFTKNYSIMIQAIKATRNRRLNKNELNKLIEFYNKNVGGNILEMGKNLPVWIQEVLKKVQEGVEKN